MALRELLVHLNQSDGIDTRLELAMDLADRHGSHLTALFINEWNNVQLAARATAEMGLAGAPALESLDRAVTTEIDRAALRLLDCLEQARKRRGIDAQWHRVNGFCEAVIQRFLPCADLCVLGHEGLAEGISSDSSLCEALLMSAGTPLLFIPKSVAVDTLASRVIVAWDGSRTSMRALNDAIPLLERADRTLVLNVDSGGQVPTIQALSGVTGRLRRHCTSVDFAQMQADDRSIAELVHAEALGFGADLIVCGAFGHSRIKENLFGGVTRELLDQSSLPLLLSH